MADKLLTISIRNFLVRQPVRRRHMKISKYVRERVSHYIKVDQENVKISRELNNLMIQKHAKSMLPLKLTIKIDKGIATISPFAIKAASAPVATATKTKDVKAQVVQTAAKQEKKDAAKPAAAPAKK